MPGFDCVAPMTGSNVPVFLSLSLALLKTYFSGGKPGKASYCKGFVLSQPVNPGESVREGKMVEKRPGFFAGALLKRAHFSHVTFRLLNWPGEAGL